MKTQYQPVTIPVKIMALNNASLSEKLLLSIYPVTPSTKLWHVYRFLSVTPVGLRKMRARLTLKGLLKGYKVSDLEAAQSEHKVAPSDQRPLVVHVRVQQHETIGGFRMREAGRIETETEAVFLRPRNATPR